MDDEDADARLEDLIAHDAAPKDLTRRLLGSPRPAGRHPPQGPGRPRRRLLGKPQGPQAPRAGPPPAPFPRGARREDGPSAAEADFWLAEFSEVDRAPETRQALRSADFVPTDEEIERIAREVDEEFRTLL